MASQTLRPHQVDKPKAPPGALSNSRPLESAREHSPRRRSVLEVELQLEVEDSLELRDVTLVSPKRSKQELKEAAQRHKDAADAHAVEKRVLLDENEEKVPLIYMRVLFVCAVDVDALCVCVCVC